MSQTTVALPRRAFDALNRHDWDGFLALMRDDVEAGSRQVALEGGYHSHPGLRRWWSDLFGTFPDYTAQVEELRDLGDVTVARVRGRGRSAHGYARRRPVLGIDPVARRTMSLVAKLLHGGRGPRSRPAVGVARWT